uniref:proliferation marker protein Ki-67 isoform X2 n=1 Tax=Semicossyphus pulcher TaxID=241346 RepID=UPI0037E9C8A2
MTLHGKIVVIKRSGGDGTEFPLTATCLFGRKPDCDIRIQLPQVSKEHCRIDFNENKEIILTNLSSVNPTRVNGEALQQSDRLKHGDVITIIDRSFRFEYPPAPTPKKRSSVGGKTETLKVLQDQQVGDSVTTDTAEKRIAEVSTDPHLKDGTNHENINRSLDRTVAFEAKADDSLLQSKTASPFNDLYQMIKKSLDVKTPRKSCASLLQTPTSRFCTPKPTSVRKNNGEPVTSTEDKSTPKKDEAEVSAAADDTKGEDENKSNGTPKSVKKQRRSFQLPAAKMAKPDAENAATPEAASPQKRIRTPPQRFTAGDVIEQICTEKSKSPKRRSKGTTPVKQDDVVTTPETEGVGKASPRSSGKAEKVKETSKKRKSGELAADLPKSQMKRKRVSFGGHLSPELFDKRLPPDSPLRKGAAPRRSLSLLRPKQSLLRRASVIGLLKEFDQEQSPAKRRTPSPKKSSAKSASPKTPTSAKKSPKSRSPSPKAATPAKKSPKSKSPSPKAATPAKAPLKSKSPSGNKLETPKSTKQTPTVQGRFSISRISTPSPGAEAGVAEAASSVAATPKLQLIRKSISRKTPKLTKSAVKVIRRSGISRASMKAKPSFADMVKFGQPKVQVVAPTKKTVIRKTKKKVVSKPQTPAKALLSHVSTGHACSPVTIVVSRAQKQKLVQPTGAAPRLVTNIAVLKKNMKMDEDLTGVSDMFKTPKNERKTKSESSAMKTPTGPATPVVEPSVLSTPEEPGEMIVSPLTVSSTVKDRRYNSEAVQRLLDGEEESSFVSDAPALETRSDDSGEQQGTDVKTTSVSTPKQKPELPDCLTGVKRVMKTPKQKAEPIEDLRGRLLKTPKQKLEQQECLTGVKRIMKTPRQKAEPIEDLRGKIMKTPKQKPEERECLTGVKRIMETPQQEAEHLEDLKVKLLETPKAPEAGDAGSEGVEEIVETPADVQESEDLSESETTDMKTPNAKSSPVLCLTGIKRIMKTPKEKCAPVEENFAITELMKTPQLRGREAGEDVEEPMEEQLTDATGQQETNEVEDQTPLDSGVEVAKELDFVLEEPQDEVPTDVIDEAPQVDVEKEADVEEVAVEEHVDEVPSGNDDDDASDAVETVSQAAVEEAEPVEQPQVDTEVETLSEEQPELETATGDITDMEPTTTNPDPEVPVTECVPEVEEATCSTDMETTATDPDPQVPVTESLPVVEEATCSTDMETTATDSGPQEPLTESSAEVEEETCNATEVETTATAPEVEKKPARGRRAKAAVQEATEQPEEPVVPAPVRGRRGKKTEAAAAPAVRQTTRGRNTKAAENKDVELTVEKSESLPSEVGVKPKRGRNAKKASDDQAEEAAAETEMVPEPEGEQIPPVEVDQEANDRAAPVEKVVLKPKRGRKAKQPEQAAPEQQDAPTDGDDVPLADVEKEVDATEVCSEQLEVVPTGDDEDKPSDATETVPQAPVTESLPEVEADAAVVQKKPVRGRRAKAAEAKPAEEKQEVTEQPEEPVVPAPVRGRRGKKTEAAAPVRQTTRGRNAKSQESTSEDQPEVSEKAEETTQVTEISTEAVTDQTAPLNHQEEKDSAPPAEEAVVKPVRGRKTKQAPVEQPQPEPERTESEELPMEEAQNSVPAAGKPRRGRKTKPDTAEQNEEAEDTVTVETKQQPPVRAKRGRNAKQDEDKPVALKEEATLAAKPRRGGRKAKQDTETETAEVQEVAAVSADKPKRGRRGKQATEEVAVVEQEEKPDVEPEAEEKDNVEPDVPVTKPTRGRGQKSSVKDEVSQAVPAKRARRGAAPPVEETTETPVQVSESASTAAEPAKRGRRAAAKTTTHDAKVNSEQVTPTEDTSSAVVEDAKVSKRAVKRKPDLKVIDDPKATPVKAVRGRKSKLDENKAEEKDLSETVVEAQPVKRARRGAKVADVTADEAESTSKAKSAEAATQPKTRRGRSAKK